MSDEDEDFKDALAAEVARTTPHRKPMGTPKFEVEATEKITKMARIAPIPFVTPEHELSALSPMSLKEEMVNVRRPAWQLGNEENAYYKRK